MRADRVNKRERREHGSGSVNGTVSSSIIERARVKRVRVMLVCAVSLGTWTLAAPLGSQAPEDGAPRDRYAAVPRAVEGTEERAAPPAESAEDRARRAQVVARVEGVAITVGELEDLLVVGATEDDVRAALDASIRRVRLTNEARRRGLFAHPEVVAAERRAHVDVLLMRDFGAQDHVGGAPAAEVDALVARLRAERVTDVDLEPLYPLRLDPRPRSVRAETDSNAPTAAGASQRTELMAGAVAGSVSSEELVFTGDAPSAEEAP